MPDPQDQMRNAAREVAAELQRAVEQAAKLARQAGEDLSRLLSGDQTPRRAAGAAQTPPDMIRELGRLRDEGLISEDEFQAKKSELLERV